MLTQHTRDAESERSRQGKGRFLSRPRRVNWQYKTTRKATGSLHEQWFWPAGNLANFKFACVFLLNPGFGRNSMQLTPASLFLFFLLLQANIQPNMREFEAGICSYMQFGMQKRVFDGVSHRFAREISPRERMKNRAGARKRVDMPTLRYPHTMHGLNFDDSSCVFDGAD